MVLDSNAILITVGITGLGLLLYEVLLKYAVPTKGIRLYFYFLFALHIVAFLDLDILNELHFAGGLTTLHLETYIKPIDLDAPIGNRLENTVVLLYVSGVAFGLLKMTLGIVKLIKLIRMSSAGKHKFERLVPVSNFQPCTFFNYILMPTDLPKTLYDTVYQHERYHVRQLHTLDMVLWRLLSVLFWFNPFVHIIRSRQSQNLEYDTDAYITQSIPKDYYCAQLLRSTFNSRKIDFFPMFNRSNVYRRIKRLQQYRDRKRPWSNLTLLLAVVLLFTGTMMSKASLLPQTRTGMANTISKPEFPPEGLGYYIDSVLQARIGDTFDDINTSYRLQLFLDITIDEKGKVIKVRTDDSQSKQAGDTNTNYVISKLLLETIANMPPWIPAKQNNRAVRSTIHEEFLFTGESE
ncbi:MAG: M56 family metallopeptidase [Maribacter sp.]|uniref:M56 family metallopeptidase n=1 Tax=Maribacter sp. TaxID=1897614 RepID=UPI00329A3FD6